MKSIHIGLLGLGTVGTGVAKILMENKALIASRIGAELHLKSVADIDTRTDRGIRLDEGVLVSDADAVIQDPQIQIVVELIGGETPAREYILKAIGAGKHVVTANKALIASHGNMLLKAAHEKGVDLAFEAGVGGCIPIVKTIRESLVGNRIESMTGILNGTCNYILSKISDDHCPFETALKEAQKNGFAEADPTLDIEGNDTAHKLAILTSLAFGSEINVRDIYVEGISKISGLDIEFADQFGYRIKLLAIAKNKGNAVEARVHPTMIPVSNPLSNINGSLNAISISGDRVGDAMLCGHGAGMLPTASAVISDIADIARNILFQSIGRVPLFSFQPEYVRVLPVLPIDRIMTHYYFRFAAVDKPGVLSKISGILGNHQISLKSVHQKGRKSEGPVPIVMFTHRAQESEVRKALNEIYELEVVTDQPVLIRIEDLENDD